MKRFGALTGDYAKFNPVVLEKTGRIAMARQITNVLKDVVPEKSYKKLKVLDVGASSGIISDYLAKYFGNVVAIDVDSHSLEIAKKTYRRDNLNFIKMDAAKMKFTEASFDIVICNQVYYCFENPKTFIKEVFRVLKPGGIVFFGARNKYTLWDAQFHLPMLSFMPKIMANFLVRRFGNSESFDVNYMNYWQLRNLCKDFRVVDYTSRIMINPNKYGYIKLMKYQKVLQIFPEKLWSILVPVLPNFIWILMKPKSATS